MAQGRRPDPFRTRKLRPGTAMVLHPTGCGRVARRRITRHTTPTGTTPAGAVFIPRHQHTHPTTTHGHRHGTWHGPRDPSNACPASHTPHKRTRNPPFVIPHHITYDTRTSPQGGFVCGNVLLISKSEIHGIRVGARTADTPQPVDHLHIIIGQYEVKHIDIRLHPILMHRLRQWQHIML